MSCLVRGHLMIRVILKLPFRICGYVPPEKWNRWTSRTRTLLEDRGLMSVLSSTFWAIIYIYLLQIFWGTVDCWPTVFFPQALLGTKGYTSTASFWHILPCFRMVCTSWSPRIGIRILNRINYSIWIEGIHFVRILWLKSSLLQAWTRLSQLIITPFLWQHDVEPSRIFETSDWRCSWTGPSISIRQQRHPGWRWRVSSWRRSRENRLVWNPDWAHPREVDGMIEYDWPFVKGLFDLEEQPWSSDVFNFGQTPTGNSWSCLSLRCYGKSTVNVV